MKRLPLAIAVTLATLVSVAIVVAHADGGRKSKRHIAPPADDQIAHYVPTTAGNPGRVEFSHLRHFNALGEKRCTTCHSAEMGLVTTADYASRVPAAVEPHGPTSRGRFCASCHDGATRLSKVSIAANRADVPIFTAARTKDAASCARCHAPADHGASFTRAHGDIAEHGGGAQCVACHRQDWTPGDRDRQAALLAAEAALRTNADDAAAALVVGPNNFCVHCHRTDNKWLER